MSRLLLSAVALALGLLPIWADRAFAGRRVALLIGNSAYQNAPALPNPQKNTEAMAAMFLKAGFDVVNAQYDVGNLQFKQAIQLFQDEAVGSDIAVVYYAGHGIEIQGTNYLIPVDAKIASDRDAEDEAITLERLAKSVDGAKRLRLVILDACRDNPFARTMKQRRTAALRGGNPGLAAVEPSPETLIAYAAKAGSEAEDCYAERSPFSTALLHNLFVPGLDIRFAFGRVLVEVLKKTGNRQEPFVYGRLRLANVIALVPPLGRPAVDLVGEKNDYSITEKVGKEQAWVVFLVQHPTGFYSDPARQQIGKLRLAEPEAVEKEKKAWEREALRRAEEEQQAARDEASAAEEARLKAEREAALKRDEEIRQTALVDAGRAKQESACKDEEARLTSLQAAGRKARDDLKQLEQELTCQRLRPLVIAALDRANAMPDISAPELVRSAQQELKRLGCFSGAVDGSLNAATKTAVQRYQNERGGKPTSDVEITDEFVSELKKQSARVCPLDTKRLKPIARRKDEDKDARPAKYRPAKQEERPAPRREATPRFIERASGGGTSHPAMIGVGF